MADMHSLIQRIVNDADFRKELSANPEATLSANGYTPTPDMVKAFSGLDDAALQELASNYSADKAAC
jgi:hypothetical protein